MPIVVNQDVVIPDDELSERFVRSGGPGGQNVNKVASKVELRWTPGTSRALSDAQRHRLLARIESSLTQAGEIIVTSALTRDQHKNRDDARAKLAALVRAAITPRRRRKKTRPSRAAKERRLKGKREQSERKARRRFDPGD